MVHVSNLKFSAAIWGAPSAAGAHTKLPSATQNDLYSYIYYIYTLYSYTSTYNHALQVNVFPLNVAHELLLDIQNKIYSFRERPIYIHCAVVSGNFTSDC